MGMGLRKGIARSAYFGPRRAARILLASDMPLAALDRRLTPARADLAAAHLSGLVEAPRYAEGRAMQVIEASAPLRRSPQADAPLETEALFGEAVDGLRRGRGLGLGAARSRPLCRLSAAARRLGAPTEPTHRVAALRTHAYPGPSIKLPPRLALSLGARLAIVRHEGDFAVTEDGLHFWARHLAELGSREPDFVAVAERFLETPYLWGGRTSEGIDCSGLVQTALTAAGIAAPRDSDMLEAAWARHRRRRPAALRARRSRVLERPCRDHARPD